MKDYEEFKFKNEQHKKLNRSLLLVYIGIISWVGLSMIWLNIDFIYFPLLMLIYFIPFIIMEKILSDKIYKENIK